MRKKYIVELTDQERQQAFDVANKLKGSPQKVKRAQILLKADKKTANWQDKQIAEAFHCRRQTVENVRKNFVLRGFELTLEGKRPGKPPRAKLLTGEQEAQIIALRLGEAPKGYANWTLRLLSERVVALEIVPSISYETIRRTLKKTG